eukprot:CAMPEP_0116136086 /NCGR_PEP_ID=MMETSP0329-20121206/11533_1 /TAXON_ID=697910 /ORGANISM="Pseudo-nitzschia arenysensis, Strain B593" /LENGTH=1223 /DNA_ID=CAMNT_0003630923 /DNA_START=318 /DNA_END=3989 /DNA_ORIENTATION=-
MAGSIEVDPDIAGPPESPASKSSTTAATTPAKDDDMAVDKKDQPPSSKKGTPSKGKRKSISIPYTQVIHDAIVALKDRTGSSSPAIQKWIMNNHPNMDPTKLKQKMNFTLKLGVKSKRFIKIKSSFKINPVWLKAEKKKKAAANAKKRKATAAAKGQTAVAAAAKKAAKPLTKAEIAAIKEKERKEKAEKERQKKERERLDKIRKRKFPIDDLKLIEEDKELKVVAPTKDFPRPTLELAMPNFPTMCRSDTMGTGIMNDIIHIYHFFRGDLGWGRFKKQKALVAPFTLEQWMECVQQVSKGWCKKARMLPPLMTHLFVVALQHLVPEKLSLALTPASWSEVLLLYMDAMQQKYGEKLKVEEDKTTIRSLGIDAEYLFYVSDEPKDVSELEAPTSDLSYLGTGILKKAHSKCVNTDPWQLNAEELLSLLKALVDDVLGTCDTCSVELEIRNDETYELLRRKKTADAAFRKIQTARNRQLAAELAAEKEKQKAEEAANIAAAEKGEPIVEKKPEKVTRSNSSSKFVTISENKLERVRREQQKAQDAYDKSCRSKRIRTEPAGMDRNFQEVYHSLNDPELVFFLQRGRPIQSDLSFEMPDSKAFRKVTWQAIRKKSVLNTFMDSLDVRGTRESNLHEALQLARRHVYDDVKEMNDKKALLREKSEVMRRLENARASYQNGRKSGRLASQSEQELIDLQNEVENLEKSVAEGNIVEEYDVELETGLDMLREFDTQEQQTQRRRANRREVKVVEEEEGIKKMHCSKLWPSGNIDDTGIVGLTVSQMMDLEERVDKLAKWETGDRNKWIASLETAIHSWNEGCLPFLISDDSSSTSNKENSMTSPEPKAKKNPVTPGSAHSNGSNNSAMSSYQIVCMIRQRLLELESRVFEATGLAMVAKETDEADENMSTSPQDEQEQIQDAWKKIIHRLKRVPAKSYTKIHAALVEAIAAARKAQNTAVVAELKHALVEYHPEAASYCKDEALEVLEKHGGYEEDSDYESDAEDNAMDIDRPTDQTSKSTDHSDLASCLCAEAIILNSSLDGQEDASRVDWIRAVKQTRTMSKLAAFVSAFVNKAIAKVEKMEEEYSALVDAMNLWGKSRQKKKKADVGPELSEVWANVNFSDEYCFVKIEEYPLWPARKCVPKDAELVSELESVDRLLVSLVGERGALRVVKTEACVPFSETLPEGEDPAAHPRDIRTQLDEAMKVARRVVRGQTKKMKPPIESLK